MFFVQYFFFFKQNTISYYKLLNKKFSHFIFKFYIFNGIKEVLPLCRMQSEQYAIIQINDKPWTFHLHDTLMNIFSTRGQHDTVFFKRQQVVKFPWMQHRGKFFFVKVEAEPNIYLSWAGS